MIRENKPHPQFKTESIEEWKARTGRNPKKVDFSKAYDHCKLFTLGIKKAAAAREVRRIAKLRKAKEQKCQLIQAN